MKNLDKEMKALLAKTSYGLTESDINNASDFINHNEFGVAFELICDQLYENNTEISTELIGDISRIALLMQLPDSSWSFLNQNAK